MAIELPATLAEILLLLKANGVTAAEISGDKVSVQFGGDVTTSFRAPQAPADTSLHPIDAINDIDRAALTAFDD